MGLTRIRAEQISDIDYKQATRVVSVTNVTLAGGAPASVDGVSLVLNDRILVTGQTTGSENGLYKVQTVGIGSTGTWVRTTDGNETGEIEAGMIVMVSEGAIYADTQWKLTTDDPIVIGTTELTFVINILSTVGGSNTQVQVNDGGTLAGFSNFVFDKTSNILSVTGNISATGNITGNYFIGNGSQLSGIDATSIQFGTSNVKVISSGGNVATSVGGTPNVLVVTATGANISGTLNTGTGNANVGNIGATNGVFTNISGTLTTAAQINITSVGTLGALSVTGNITGSNLSVSTGTVTTGNIVNSNANGVGNIGSSTTYFNTVFAKATSAQYADLAEKYTADADYAPGTVVAFGGEYEVTLANEEDSTRVAGVISTNPAFIMNDDIALSNGRIATVALQGRVPCQVVDSVRKGDMMVAAGNGAARANNAACAGSIIGKALENFDGAHGIIEVVIGRS